MASRKLKRKQLLKEPDEFLSFSARLIEYLGQHKKGVIATVAGFLLVLVLAVSIRGYINGREDKAFAMLAKVQKTYAENRLEKESLVALEAVEADLKQLVENYGGRTAGRLGTYLYGAYLLDAGKSDKAIAYFDRALGGLNSVAGLRQIILSALALAHEQKQDWQQAISYYSQIEQGALDLMKDMALYQLARLYEQTGKIAESKTVLQKIVTDYPSSLYAGPAREMTPG